MTRYDLVRLIGTLAVCVCSCSQRPNSVCTREDARPEPDMDAPGFLFPVEQDGMWGYINSEGCIAIPFRFEDAAPFAEGLARVKKDGLFGYIGSNGVFIIEPTFAHTSLWFSDGRAVVRDDQTRKYGYIDQAGQLVIQPVFDIATPFSEGMAVVRIGLKVGYINRSGDIVIPARFEDGGEFSEGLAPAKTSAEHRQGAGESGGQWGYLNKQGEWAIPPRYEYASGFSDVLAFAEKEGTKWLCIDKTGATVFEVQCDSVLGFSEGLATVVVGKPPHSRYGYIDTEGKTVIEPDFEMAFPFSENLAVARREGKWGFIDKSGAWAISPEYVHTPNSFRNGLALVDFGDGIGYINKQGEVIWPPQPATGD